MGRLFLLEFSLKRKSVSKSALVVGRTECYDPAFSNTRALPASVVRHPKISKWLRQKTINAKDFIFIGHTQFYLEVIQLTDKT